jgi:hypothetical protein
MNLTDAIYKIEYSIAGEESYAFINKEDDYDRNRLTIYLSPVIKLFDYFIEIDGREITLEEIDVMLKYRVTFEFDELDIVNEKCSYSTNVEFRSAYAFDIIEQNGLSKDALNDQIESDIRDGRNIVSDEPSFKVFLDSLQ